MIGHVEIYRKSIRMCCGGSNSLKLLFLFNPILLFTFFIRSMKSNAIIYLLATEMQHFGIEYDFLWMNEDGDKSLNPCDDSLLSI